METCDHCYTDAVVCPHCGYKEDDSWDRRGDGGEDQCPECGKWFEWAVEFEPKYTTEKRCAPKEHVWEVYWRANRPDEQGRDYGTLGCSICGKTKSACIPPETT